MSSQTHGDRPAGGGEVDSLDPHHMLHTHHVIVPVRVLAGVLAVLLLFTVLTVFFSRAEGWIARAFGVQIPHLVNVAVALSIAVVKSTLVAMYFMQLRYDNPLNALVFGFCLFAVGLFLFFTMTDLGTRSVLYPYKAPYHVEGGTGDNRLGPGPMYKKARDRAIERWGEAEYARRAAEAHASHAAASHHAPAAPSDASRSRPLRGSTSSRAEPGHESAPAGH